jgi:hypothetical protein
MKLLLLTVMLMISLCVDVVAQSKEAFIEDLKWTAIVSEREASFTFPPTRKESWSWYQKKTGDHTFEYVWNITVRNNKSGYGFGPALIKPRDSKPVSGSLSELIETCSHELWQLNNDGGKGIGDYGNATVIKGKVCVTITDAAILKTLFASKPKTVDMKISTPDFSLQKIVSLTYKN